MSAHTERALKRANFVRSARAAWKRKLASGDADVFAVLYASENGADELRTWRVVELLQALPLIGRNRALVMLGEAFIAETATVGALTERQRKALLDAVEARDYIRQAAPV